MPEENRTDYYVDPDGLNTIFHFPNATLDEVTTKVTGWIKSGHVLELRGPNGNGASLFSFAHVTGAGISADTWPSDTKKNLPPVTVPPEEPYDVTASIF